MFCYVAESTTRVARIRCKLSEDKFGYFSLAINLKKIELINWLKIVSTQIELNPKWEK